MVVVADFTGAVEGSTAAVLAVEHFTVRVATTVAGLTAAAELTVVTAVLVLAGITEAALTEEAPTVAVDTMAAWVRSEAALLSVHVARAERLVVLAVQHGHPVPTARLPMATGTPLVTRAGLLVWEPPGQFITAP
jgi:hypothetical protein